ncbi:hypothetical protein D9M68_815920 [compost metagenome]
MRILHVLFDRHQAFLARLLQDVELQRHELHVARLGVAAALEAAGQTFERRFDDLHLVVDDEGTQGRTEDGCHLERQCLEHHADVAAVEDVHAEDAKHRNDKTDDDEHVLGPERGRGTDVARVTLGNAFSIDQL